MTTRRRVLGALVSPRTKRTPHSTASVSKQGIAHVYTRKIGFGERMSANDDTSQTNCHGFCVAPWVASNRDSEPTKRLETRGHSSWLDVVFSWIRLHRLRMSSMSACKHHGVLRWPRGRRRAAKSNVGHEGAQGAIRIDRDTHTCGV